MHILTIALCLFLLLQSHVKSTNVLTELIRIKEKLERHCCVIIYFLFDHSSFLQDSRPYLVIGKSWKNDDMEAASKVLAKSYSCAFAVTNNKGLEQISALLKLLSRFRSKEVIIFSNQTWFLGDKKYDVKITILEQHQSDKFDNLYQHIQCPGKGMRLLENIWKPYSGFVAPYTECPHPLKGINMDISWTPITPFAELRNGVVSGSDVYLVQSLARHFQFSFQYKMEKTWLEASKTGQLSGVIAMVRNGSAFLGIGRIPMFESINNLVDFAGIINSNEPRICSPKPKPLKPYWNMIKPFSLGIWIASFSCFPVGFSFFVVLGLVNKKGYSFSGKSLGLLDSIFLLLQSVFSPVGRSSKLSKSRGLNIFFFSWTLFAFFVPHFYLSDFRAYLMEVDYEKTIDREEDIFQQGKDFYLPNGMDLAPVLKNSPSKNLRQLYALAVARHTFFDAVDGRRPEYVDRAMVKTGGTAPWIMEVLRADYPETLRRFGENPWRLSKRKFFQYYSGIVVAKRQKFGPDVEKACNRLRDAGLTDFFLVKDVKLRYLLDDDKGSQMPGPFEMEHIFGVLMILVIGLVSGLLAFSYELFHLAGKRAN